MQESEKFSLKKNVRPNGLQKYMRLRINNKLSFIDRIRFLISSLDSLVKNFGKNDLKQLSQELDNNALHLVKKDFILMSV